MFNNIFNNYIETQALYVPHWDFF